MTKDFEERQEARRQRLLDRADKAQKSSDVLHKKAHDMAGAIPFGQPILVGHHSERRDRNFRGKIHKTLGRSFAEAEKAEQLARQAAKVGKAGISSDDPEAIEKLQAKLENLENNHVLMKAVNKAIRDNKTEEKKISAIVLLGLSEAQAVEIIQPDSVGRIGFATYAFTNNSSNIRRIKERIEQLKLRDQREDLIVPGKGYSYCEKAEDNRIWFVFDEKPNEVTRLLLKSHGFKWSPSRSAWIRQLNNAGIFNAQQVKKALDESSRI